MIEVALNTAAFLFLVGVGFIGLVLLGGLFQLTKKGQKFYRNPKEEVEEEPTRKLTVAEKRARWES